MNKFYCFIIWLTLDEPTLLPLTLPLPREEELEYRQLLSKRYPLLDNNMAVLLNFMCRLFVE